jgi:MGT family glycosyltransferase
MGTGIFLNVPAHGHINPTVPIVNELVKRGETILYFSLEEFREKIEKTGAEFRPYSSQELEGAVAPNGNYVRLTKRLLQATERILAENIDYIKTLNPDYIIHDSMSPWGKYMAKYLGIKAINTTSTFVFTGEATNKAAGFKYRILKMAFAEGPGEIFKILSLKRRLRIKYGINPQIMDLFRNNEDLNIVFTSSQFQPAGAVFGDQFKFIGPSIYGRGDSAAFSLAHMKGKKLIYVSLGTIANEQLAFYQECIKAFTGKDLHILISVGNKIDKNDLGPVPANIFIENYVPQIKVLKQTSLFISHGGMNSVNESLYFGVPLLILPQRVEQIMVAKRVEELGAGICLIKNPITAGSLYKNSIRIMETNSFYENAGKIGATFKAAGGYKVGVDTILNYIYGV